MKKMEDIQRIISEIIESVDNFQEPYNEIAFKEILRHRLSSPKSLNTLENISSINQPESSVDIHKNLLRNDWEVELFNNIPEAYIIAESGSRDQQTLWAVITLHSRSKEPDNDSIRKVLRDELGISPQSKSNTARTLRSLTPQFLSREKDGKSYVYKPNRSSIKIFDDLKNNQ